MKNTCLYPFYEYIIKNWIGCKKELPKYDDIVRIRKVEPQGERVELEQRKRLIWEETRSLLELDSSERKSKFAELKQRAGDCKLCISCEKCEAEYWRQLELALDDCQGDLLREKCEFLIPDDINKLLERKDRPVDIYLDFYKRRSSAFEDNFLVMLKGFSSSTPILLNNANNTNFYSGGGFFFKWNGLGVAVDPGYMFVQNLHNYGISVLDIDVVIVTHEHIDHSNDVRLLDDLHRNVAHNCREKGISWNREEFSLSRVSAEKHKIKWYMDRVTYEEALVLKRAESGFDSEYNELFCVCFDEDDSPKLERECSEAIQILDADEIRISSEVSMKVFPTRHAQYRQGRKKDFFKHTFGCVFECCDKVGEKRGIGYTSDTSLHSDIYDRMYALMRTCQVIVSNISGIYETDVLLQSEKERHLGYYGCFQIAGKLLLDDECKLRYYLLSEFSNQISDIRYDISKYMQQELNKVADYNGKEHIGVFPTEVGMLLDLKKLQIKCTACNTFSDNIYILRPYGENKDLQYICSECIYSDER